MSCRGATRTTSAGSPSPGCRIRRGHERFPAGAALPECGDHCQRSVTQPPPRTARMAPATLSHSTLCLLQLDPQGTVFEDCQLDLVTGAHVLHHLGNMKATFTELRI